MLKKIKKLDEAVIQNIKKLHSKRINRIMAFITHLGTGGVVWFAVTLPLLLSKNMRAVGVNIVFSLVMVWLVGEIIIKHIVARVRPSDRLPEEEQIVKPPKFYSFPSGHAASSFSVVGVTALCCPPLIYVPVIIMATLIAFSRLYLRVHYLTDVVVGTLLGIGCGLVSVPLFNYLIERIGVSF